MIPFDPIALLAAAPPAGAAEAAAAPIETVWDFVVKGGVMMIPIALCSLIAFTVFVERLVSLRRKRVIPPAFVARVRKEIDAGERARAIETCRADGSPVARVISVGLRRLDAPLEVLERHMQEAGQREVLRLRKHLRVLSVLAAVTPLMGLLGTILGMIRAFQTVAASADALGKTERLASGIYEAMITTAGGLVVAIPALIAFHWLAARVQALVMQIDEIAVDFVEDHALGGRVAPEPPRASAETSDASAENGRAPVAATIEAAPAAPSA